MMAQSPPRRLLLVDDDPRNLAVLEARLQALGHKLIFARGGQEAIERFDAEPPDLVLLDLAMPGVDGLAVLAHIRSSQHGHVPVVLVTAHTERQHRLAGLQAGADDFLEKPLDGPILLARVRTLLALKDARDELQTSRDTLQSRNSLLEKLQREQVELMQFIIHDLKTPISLITINLQLARECTVRSDLEAALETLADAQDGAHQLRAMVNDLLTVSRLEESSFPVDPEALCVGDLALPVLAAYSRRANQKNISLSHRLDRNCNVWGDPSLLRRVLENLLENSLRHTPAFGRVGLDARLGSQIEIAVSNNGPCIPSEDRVRIFEKFARGRAETSLPGSAGLGLYFCKRAIEAHGGHIDVHQTTEWPTSFVIQLPRHS
jgi:two-component system sensor histidine kinase/response regulator